MDETTARRIVEAVLSDLRERVGFDAAWDLTDSAIRQEIRADLLRAVMEAADAQDDDET